MITPERGPEIRALFSPHTTGDELAPTWTLHSFGIDTSTISVWVAGPDDAFAQLALDHHVLTWDLRGHGRSDAPPPAADSGSHQRVA